MLGRRYASLLFELSFNHDVDSFCCFSLRINYLLANVVLLFHEVDKLLNRCSFHADKTRYPRQKLKKFVRAPLLDFIERSVEVTFVEDAIGHFRHAFDGCVPPIVRVNQS